MYTEVIHIKNTMGLKLVTSKQLNSNEFIKILTQCMDSHKELFFTCDFIIADFCQVTSFDLPLNDLIKVAQNCHHRKNQNNNSLILSIATKNNNLYKLFNSWQEILSDHHSLQSTVFRDIERATQWIDVKVSQS